MIYRKEVKNYIKLILKKNINFMKKILYLNNYSKILFIYIN